MSIMSSRRPTGLFCGVVLAAGVLLGGSPAGPAAGQTPDAADTIRLQLASGRSVRGQLDPRTDASRLWLRRQRGKALLRRPIHWDRVVLATVAGSEISGEDLRRRVAAVRARLPLAPPDSDGPRTLVLKGSDDELDTASGDVGEQAQPLQAVRSLAMAAAVGNWDSDVETDGLVVEVFPLDGGGEVVPVRGVLHVELLGERIGVPKRPGDFRLFGRWTCRIRPEDFGPQGAVRRLPFQSVHPEFDLDVAPHAAVHARLSVPGQGTFEATATWVRIRPYSPIRDHLQQATGRRFFPGERNGRAE